MIETAGVTLEGSKTGLEQGGMLAARIADAKPSPTAAISDEVRRFRALEPDSKVYV